MPKTQTNFRFLHNILQFIPKDVVEIVQQFLIYKTKTVSIKFLNFKPTSFDFYRNPKTNQTEIIYCDREQFSRMNLSDDFVVGSLNGTIRCLANTIPEEFTVCQDLNKIWFGDDRKKLLYQHDFETNQQSQINIPFKFSPFQMTYDSNTRCIVCTNRDDLHHLTLMDPRIEFKIVKKIPVSRKHEAFGFCKNPLNENEWIVCCGMAHVCIVDSDKGKIKTINNHNCRVPRLITANSSVGFISNHGRFIQIYDSVVLKPIDDSLDTGVQNCYHSMNDMLWCEEYKGLFILNNCKIKIYQ